MNKQLLGIALAGFLLFAAAAPHSARGQDNNIVEETTKLGQTTMQFLTFSVDPRSAAMGNAVTAQPGTGSVAQFYNPASMAQSGQTVDVSLGQADFLAGLSFSQASASYQPAGGVYGTFGVSVLSVSYMESQATIRAANNQGFIDIGTYSPDALSVGVAYARSFTDRFSAGVNVKYVRQALGPNVPSRTSSGFSSEEFSRSTAAFDFGVLYRTGFRSLNFAASFRNFSGEVDYIDKSHELPLSFQVGFSMDVLDLTPFRASDQHSLTLSLDGVTPRSYKQNVRLGGEYEFLNTLALRAGYAIPSRQEEGINLGAGLEQDLGGVHLGVDYSFTQFSVLDNIHRVAVNFGL